MSDFFKRCEECGSWEAQCYSEIPVEGCGCRRCANAANVKLKSQLAESRLQLDNLAEAVLAFNADSSFHNISAWSRCVRLAKAVREG